MAQDSEEDLRRFIPRHTVGEGKVPILPVRYRVVSPPPEGDEGDRAASLFDLHLKGFQLRCPDLLPKDALLEVDVAYSPRLRPVGPLKRLTLRAKVRWSRRLDAPFGHEQYAAGLELLGGGRGDSETSAKVAELIAYCQEASLLF